MDSDQPSASLARAGRSHLLLGHVQRNDRSPVDRAFREEGHPALQMGQGRPAVSGLQADQRCDHRGRRPQGHALRRQRPRDIEDSRRGRQAQARQAKRRAWLPYPRHVHGRGNRGHGPCVDRGVSRTHQGF